MAWLGLLLLASAEVAALLLLPQNQPRRSLRRSFAPQEAFKDIVIPGVGGEEEDPRVWVPQTECLDFRPLCFCTSNGYYVNLLRFKGGGVLGTVSLAVVARMHGVRLGKAGVAMLAAVPLAAWLLGLVTIELVPAVNGATDGIHAIKMGYPVFWVVALLFVAGRFAARLAERSADADGQ